MAYKKAKQKQQQLWVGPIHRARTSQCTHSHYTLMNRTQETHTQHSNSQV